MAIAETPKERSEYDLNAIKRTCITIHSVADELEYRATMAQMSNDGTQSELIEEWRKEVYYALIRLINAKNFGIE